MAVEKAIASSSLVEVIDRILDKGVVIDAWVRVSLRLIFIISFVVFQAKFMPNPHLGSVPLEIKEFLFQDFFPIE